MISSQTPQEKIVPSTCLLSNSTYPTKPAHQPTPLLKPLQQLQTSTLPLIKKQHLKGFTQTSPQGSHTFHKQNKQNSTLPSTA